MADAQPVRFPGMYMRPNLESHGLIPATGKLSRSPDIWLAENVAIDEPSKTLATAASYDKDSGRGIKLARDNYIYVRAYNGTHETQSRTVRLYHAAGSVLQWPAQWEHNLLLTDRGDDTCEMNDVPVHAIGVADQTFVWKNVPPPPSHKHHCLIAHLNDAANSNPLPSVNSSLDLAVLVRNNLGFGWRNTDTIKTDDPSYRLSTQLAIEQNLPAGAEPYQVSASATGWKGFRIAVTCSQRDSLGSLIALERQRIDSDTQTFALRTCYLEPGFDALLSLVITKAKRDQRPKSGASVTIECHALPQGQAAREAVALGLVDDRVTRALLASTSPPTAETVAIPLGAFTWIVEG